MDNAKNAVIALYIDEKHVDSFSEIAGDLKSVQKQFKERYGATYNTILQKRYRDKGFIVHFALFTHSKISEVINVQPDDQFIDVGMSFEEHQKTLIYPDSEYILKAVGETKKLIITGHMVWDCVDRLAEFAYNKGRDVLVDEDLTDFLPRRIDQKEVIDPLTYPTMDPKKFGADAFKSFLLARKERPWFWQDYS